MTQKRPPQKGVPMSTQRLVTVIPKDLYKAVKIAAVEREQDLKDLVIEALQRFLKEGGKRKE